MNRIPFLIAVDYFEEIAEAYGMTWRAIPSAPDYEASNAGEVRRKGGQPLKPWRHRSGHCYVRLGNSCPSRQVHHLVLEAFGKPRPEGMEVRHLDGNPANNRLENLAWGTRRENIADCIRHRGTSPGGSISYELARSIRARLTGKRGEQKRIALELGLSTTLVNRIAKGKTYVQ